jgi:hypothetical protein
MEDKDYFIFTDIERKLFLSNFVKEMYNEEKDKYLNIISKKYINNFRHFDSFVNLKEDKWYCRLIFLKFLKHDFDTLLVNYNSFENFVNTQYILDTQEIKNKKIEILKIVYNRVIEHFVIIDLLGEG